MFNKIKKSAVLEIFTSLTLFLIITSLILFMAGPVMAQSGSAEETLTTIGGAQGGEILPGFSTTGHAEASYEQGASNITSAILFVVDLFKYLIGTVAVLVLIISGIRLVTAGKNIEEIAQSQKENIKYAIIGLGVIVVADTMIQQVFFGEQGEVLRSEADVQLAAERGTEQLKSIYSLMAYFAGSVAIFMIIYAGIRLVTAGGQEEVTNKMKKVITWAIIGLMLIGVAEFVVKDIVFPEQGARLTDPDQAARLIVMVTNFVSGFVATIAIAMYMYGGFLYVTAGGQEDNTGKAKKVFMGATIGLVLALAAFALVNTLIDFQPAPS